MSSAPATPTDLPKPGDLIAGKYEVESILGAGGMGVVVAARHTALRQRVAVKFLLPAAMRLPDASARFLREARAVVAIQSEHVARVHDVGTLESGAPYIVMEHLSGTDLGRLIKERGALSVEEAVDFTLQAIEAIAEAHTLGIVHRDLKPANLFLTHRAEGSPLIKVLDFGLSKMALQDGGALESSLTATNAVIGSPHYMSPEQLRSLKYVDQRTDIWALGVILYELLTGKRPFEGASLTAICMSVATDAPPPPRARRPDLPPQLEAVILRCLEKDPARRLSSVAEIAAGLAPFASARAWTSIDHIARLLPGVMMPTPPVSPARPPMASASVEHVPRPPPPAPVEQAPPPRPPLASVEPLPPPPPMASVEPLPPARPPLSSTVSLQLTAPVAAPDTTTAQIGAWGGTGPVARRKPVGLLLGGLGVMAVGVAAGVLGWALFLRNPASTTAAASGTASVSVQASAPASVEATARPAATASASANVEAPPVQSAQPEPSTSPTTVASASAAAPKPVARATATVLPKATPAPASKPRVRAIDIRD